MSVILSLLSGKGGSGKTTIALSLSKMLSECGITVLLIDCDLATNGATYFFESKLDNKECILSLSDIMNCDMNKENKSPVSIDKCFSFIPSNTSFSNDAKIDLVGSYLQSFIEGAKKQFKVIILDCQAGYSNVLNKILEYSTINLVVLEPDAISSSAIRVLYARFSNMLERNKTYQIFNKITDEEYEIYNKVISGTLFDSLPPITFNWEVRKAFAFAQVPEMISTNVEFGNDIFQLAKLLFPKLNDELSWYSNKIREKEKEELELELIKMQNESFYFMRKKKYTRALFVIPSILFLLLSIYVIIMIANTSYVIIVAGFIVVIMMAFWTFYGEKLYKSNSTSIDYEYEIRKLENKLKNINSVTHK